MEKILDNLSNMHKNYILPLFWQHGESAEIIGREIEKIHDAGITEFCVESRPFEDFCGPKWWQNLEYIIKKCKELNMRFWIFDDKHFPSGYCGGALETAEYSHLRKWHVIERNMDVYGPQADAAVILPELREEFEEAIIGAAAFRRSGDGVKLLDEYIDLSDNISGNMLWFDVPDGVWRVFFYIRTRDGVSGRSRFMVDTLNPEACRLMIERIYQPHYDHFAQEFGGTIAGFFTDEPGFRNLPKGYNTGVGVQGAAMPWNDSLAQIIEPACLAALWYDCGERTILVRNAYMEAVSDMYSRYFCGQLGDWCRDHGVMYIGHVLEDMNVSGRLGDGAGYYFRALSGQDMSGVDAVYHQIMPGYGDMCHAVFASTGNNDPEFYDFALAKLGASMAHIQENKHGRAMCEIFGGYGWAEGLPMMKWLADHFLAAGINCFVPHAFSPKENDPDCPPHLYGGGRNPEYKYLRHLMDYINRMCHMLSGGRTVPSGAVIYHAEAEWSGGGYMYEQKPLKQLLKKQLDFDIIPFDAVLEGTIRDGRLVLCETEYPLIVVPYAERLPRKAVSALERLRSGGVDVIFTDALPEDYPNGTAVPLDKIADYAESYRDVTLGSDFDAVRILHYRSEGTDIYVLNNESVRETFDGTVSFRDGGGRCGIYDAMENRLYATDGDNLHIRIEPYSCAVVVFSDKLPEGLAAYEYRDIHLEPLDLRLDIELRPVGEAEFKLYKKDSVPVNITSRNGIPDFCGEMRYTADLEAEAGEAVIDLGHVGETAELYVNGTYCGVRICPPYRFDVCLTGGRNKIEVVCTNNPAYRERDKYSRFIMLTPSGIGGPIRIGR